MEQSYKVWWDKKNQIVRQKSWGINDESLAKRIVADEIKLLQKHTGAGLLVDGSEVPVTTKESGKIFKDAMKSEYITYVAFLQPTKVMFTILPFILNTINLRKKFKIFYSEKEAIVWLQKKTLKNK